MRPWESLSLHMWQFEMPNVCVMLSPHLMPLSGTSQYVALTLFSHDRLHSDAIRPGMRCDATTCTAASGGGRGGSGRRQQPRARGVLKECGDVAEGDVRDANAGGRAVVGRAPAPAARLGAPLRSPLPWPPPPSAPEVWRWTAAA